MRPPSTRSRSGDSGFKARFKAKIETCKANAVLIVGLGLVLVSIGLMFLALQFYASQAESSRQAKDSCERTKLLGPYAVDDFASRGVYPPDVLRVARESIPKSCD